MPPYAKQLRLFSRFHEGARISAAMLYSVTKECIALKTADDAVGKGFAYVVDGCCGAGGNTIAFARRGLRVAAVEINEDTLHDCIHNAKLYGVDGSVQFFLGSVLDFECAQEAGFDPAQTLFFSSPEWGGPGYKRQKVFDLESLQPPLSALLAYVRAQGYKAACLYLPRTSDLRTLRESGCVEVQYMFQEGHCDAICAWYTFAADNASAPGAVAPVEDEDGNVEPVTAESV